MTSCSWARTLRSHVHTVLEGEGRRGVVVWDLLSCERGVGMKFSRLPRSSSLQVIGMRHGPSCAEEVPVRGRRDCISRVVCEAAQWATLVV